MGKEKARKLNMSLFDIGYNESVFCVDLLDSMRIILASDEFYKLHHRTREEFHAQYRNRYGLFLSIINDSFLIEELYGTKNKLGKECRWDISLLLEDGICDCHMITATYKEHDRFVMFGKFIKFVEKDINKIKVVSETPLLFENDFRSILLISANEEMKIVFNETSNQEILSFEESNKSASLRKFLANEDISKLQGTVSTAIEQGKDIIDCDVKFNVDNNAYNVRLRGCLITFEYQLCALLTVKDIAPNSKVHKMLDFVPEVFDLVASKSGLSFWAIDFDSKQAIHNKDAQRVFGVSEVIENIPEGLRKCNFIHPEDCGNVEESMRTLMNTDDNVKYNVRFRRPNSDGYWWGKVVFTRIYDSEGKCHKAIGTVVDISEQKRLDNLYYDFVNSKRMRNYSSVLFVMSNLSTNTIESLQLRNVDFFDVDHIKKIDELFIYGESILVNQKDTSRFRKECNVSNLLTLFEKGTMTVHYEYLLKINKQAIMTDVEFSMSLNPITENITLFIALTDISNEHANKMVLQQIINNEFDYVYKVDVSTNYIGLIIENKEQKYISKNLNTFKALKESILELTFDEHKECIEKEFEPKYIFEKLKIHDTYSLTFEMMEQDKKLRKLVRLFKVDQVRQVFGIAMLDITTEYHQELENRDVLKQALLGAQEANKSKSRFLSSMSHDIRTPLNAILGLVNIAYMDIEDPHKMREDLSIIQSSSLQLLEVLNEVLDISKIETGNLVGSISEVNIIDAMCAVKKMLESIYTQKKQNLILETTSVIHPEIIADKNNLIRVWMNVLTNASKYSPNNSTVVFTASEQATNTKTPIFKFEIRDQGYGIEKEKLEEIFVPFYRDPKHQDVIEGTGLGLSIVKTFVESKGGTVDVESEVGKGTLFTISIPYDVVCELDDAKEVRQEKEMMENELVGLNVLVAEDNAINSMVLKRVLENLGIRVCIVDDGLKVVETFCASDASEFDVVLMDIQMPNCDGHEATKRIRKSNHPNALSVPIYAMTALSFADDIRNSKNAGMNGHITKPLNPMHFYDIFKPIHEEKFKKK